MKRLFLIEVGYADGTFKQHFVKAKDYGEACVKVTKIFGEGDNKLLGMFEQSQVDKDVWNKIK